MTMVVVDENIGFEFMINFSTLLLESYISL